MTSEREMEGKRDSMKQSREDRVRKVLALICAFKTKITENKNTEELPSKGSFSPRMAF